MNEDQLFAESIIESMISIDPESRADLEDIILIMLDRPITSTYRHQMNKPETNLTIEVLAHKGEELLGRGTFGRVYEKILPNGQKVAVKRIELLGLDGVVGKLEITREGMMKNFDHPNVLKLFSIFNDANFV